MKILESFDVENPQENTSLINNQTSNWWGRKVFCCKNRQSLCQLFSLALVVGGAISAGFALSQPLEHDIENLTLFISGGIEMMIGFGSLYSSIKSCWDVEFPSPPILNY